MYQQIRQMKGRGTKVAPADLVIGNVVRVDGVKYRVQAAPQRLATGSLMVEVYSEDNQMDVLCLSARRPIAMIGSL